MAKKETKGSTKKALKEVLKKADKNEPKLIAKVKFLGAKMFLYDDDSMKPVNKFHGILSSIWYWVHERYFNIREIFNEDFSGSYEVICIESYVDEKKEEKKKSSKKKQ